MAQSLSSKLNLTVTASGFSSGLGEISNTQFFTSPGTWSKPPDASSVEVWIVGGGGGGGGGNNNQPQGSPAQRGADGGVGMKIIQNITGPVPVTVGAAGGGGAMNANGTIGGTSVFGPYPGGGNAIATGGAGGRSRSNPSPYTTSPVTHYFGTTANCQIDVGAMVRNANNFIGGPGPLETHGNYTGHPGNFNEIGSQHLGWMSKIDLRQGHYTPLPGVSNGVGYGQGGSGGGVTGGPPNPASPGKPGAPGSILVISYKD